MKHTILLVMFLGLLASVSAQNTQNAEWTTYLEGYQISQIADAGAYLWLCSYKVDQDEYSWRATDREIIRFEKATGTAIHFGSEILGISNDDFIRSIKCDKNGMPWASGDFDGILRMTMDNEWILTPSFVKGGWKHEILVADDGVIWATSDDVLVRYEGDEVDTFTANGLIISLAEDKDGNIWMGTSEGFKLINDNLVKFDGESQTMYSSSPTGLAPMVFLQIIPDEKGNKWMAGSFGFIWLFGGNKLIKFDDFDWQVYDLPMETLITSIALQDDSIVWLGTDYGLLSFSNSRWTIFNIENSDLPSNEIYSVVNDENGIKWLGTDVGLVSLKLNENQNFILGVENIDENQFELYPNPAHDYITLKMPGELKNSTADIINIQGQVLKSVSVTNNQKHLDINALPTGVYLLRIQSDENQFVKKFVKQ